MDAVLRIAVQWLHVTAGVLWIGGGFYTLLVQLPAFLAAPPPARGPVMAQLAPRQITYILRVAEITIVTGLLNLIVSGRAQQLGEPFGSRWAIVMLLGILLAIGLYALIRAVVVPLTMRMLALGPKAAAGDAGAAAEAGALVGRLRRIGAAQLVLGVLILLAMVTARFS
jgi:uncharacterized membrane protein